MLRKIAILGLTLSVAACATIGGPGLEGDWKGSLQTPQGELRLLFQFAESDGDIGCSIVSLDQGEATIPCGEVSVDGESLQVTVPAISGQYEATVEGDQISGQWHQAGFSFDLNLAKVD